MTSRILPRDEWHRLVGTELEDVAPLLPPHVGQVLVVEDEGRIVGTWALIPMMHAEGLWIAESHRGQFGVVKRLLAGMRRMAQACGLAAVQTGAITPQVEDFIQRLGGSPLPGRAFLLPMRGN